ncbi:MAG: DUF4332 domain-containing protein, partial [Planctomycetota bacterium]
TRGRSALSRIASAVRLALLFENMRPIDALLLISVYRKSRESIASESPAQLHRDLLRFSLSTPGNRMLGSAHLASISTVRQWVHAAKQAIAMQATQACQAYPAKAA